jgi:hypothetical protein
MFGIGKKPEIKKEVVKMGNKIYQLGRAYVDKNGEVKFPDGASDVTEHIITSKIWDNGVELIQEVAKYYTYTLLVADEAPEPVKQEERSPVVARKR